MTNISLDLWRSKLASWKGKYDASNPAITEAAHALAQVLATANEAAAQEVIMMFAAAFQINYDDALKLVAYVPAPAESDDGGGDGTVPMLGTVKRYVDWLIEQESPPQYHVFSLLTAFSAALARRTRIMLGPYPIFPNMYTVLVGPSGARKDSSIDIATTLIHNAWPALNVMPVEGSAQGMADNLSARWQSTGVGDGMLAVDEMRVLMGGRKEGYKGEIPIWLTDWFKCPDVWKRGLSSRLVEVQNLYIVLLAGTTMEWLVEMPPSLLKGGFFPRTAIVTAQGKKHWRFHPIVPRNIGQDMLAHLADALIEVPDMMTLAPPAMAMMTDWYENQLPTRAQSAAEWHTPFIERAHVHALKLCQVLNLLEHRGSIVSLDTAEYAIKLVDWLDSTIDNVLRIINTNESQQIFEDVIQLLRRKRKPMTQQDITRALRNKHRAIEIKTALDTLVYHKDLAAGTAAGERVFSLTEKGLESVSAKAKKKDSPRS